MSRGIIVDHKETGVRYAVSEGNYNPKVHKKVRELRPGETVQGFRPLRREALGGSEEANTPEQPAKSEAVVSGSAQQDTSTSTKTTSNSK